MAVDIPKWGAMKEVLRELKKPEVQEKYDTIIIDTAPIAWELCEQFICQQKDVEEIGEIPWGRGYKLCTKEFNTTMRNITMLGYGLVFISHSEEKSIPGGEEGETLIFPALEKRSYRIINGMVDLIAYIEVDPITRTRNLITRSNKNIVAGSRFKYLPERITLGYDELVASLADAIEKQGKEKGEDMIIDERLEFIYNDRPFAEAMAQASTLWTQLIAKNEQNLSHMKQIIKNHFGEVVILSQTKESQQELLELVINDFKELLENE